VIALRPLRRRGFGDGAVDGDLVEDEADNPVVGLQRDCLSLAKTPSRIHSSRRLRIVVAEQVVSAIAW
jgi:hypothetical protein